MEIMRAIERADELCPNPYTLEEKLSWCDEVTAELRRSVIKVYDSIETSVNARGELMLPDNIPFERVEAAFINGRRLEKQDFRSFAAGYNVVRGGIGCGGRLRIVYLALPEPIRFPDIRGEFNTGGNYIEISEAPFIVGDKLEIAKLTEEGEPNWEKAEIAFAVEVTPDKVILDRDAVPPETSAALAIRRVINDVTAVDEAPYDRMYIEYILAKIALYQHDYVSYNAHMTQYNSLFETFRREVNSRGPLTRLSAFRNYFFV